MKMMDKRNKKGQEEMVGFVLIIVMVAVILLFLLFFALRSKGTKESVENFEVDSFLQSALQYTTSCQLSESGKPISMQNLIFECVADSESVCYGGEKACETLNSELGAIVAKSWPVGEERPAKGVELVILGNGAEVLRIDEGNVTGEYKGGVENA